MTPASITNSRHRSMTGLGCVVLVAGLLCGRAGAQVTPVQSPNPGPPPASPRAPGEVIDRVVAVVNNDPVLNSDLDEERRLVSFEPITNPEGGYSRQRALQRLINRTLILQQARIQGQPPITDAAVKVQLEQLRKELPACQKTDCASDGGWKRFVESNGFDEGELTDLWRQRMEVLQFIELRFRGGIRITPDQVSAYYKDKMLPQYRRQGVTPPTLDALSGRIREVLLEQQVSGLLVDWLKSLRAQGSIRIMNVADSLPEEGTEP